MKKNFGKMLVCLAVVGLAFALAGCPMNPDRTHNPGNDAGPPPGWASPGAPPPPPPPGPGPGPGPGDGVNQAALLVGAWDNVGQGTIEWIDFFSNGTFESGGPFGWFEGTWTVSGNTLTLNITHPSTMQQTATFALTNSNNTLSLTLDMGMGMETMTFSRAW